MKWTRTQLLQNGQNVTFDEDVKIDSSELNRLSLINAAKDVHVDGSGYLDDDNDRFYVKMHITGIMLCPDAITNEEIEVSFDTESSETYVFGETEDESERVVTDEVIDLLPAVIDDILLEVPLQVTDAADGEYPEGNGWKVYSEAEYQESRKDQMDPRLAKLKQFENK